MGLPSVPAFTHSICLYAIYLACMLKFSSVKQHHGIIGLMHIEFGLDNLIGDWQPSSLLAGVKYIQGNAPNRTSLSTLIFCVAFILSSISLTMLMLPSGPYGWLPFLAFSTNPIYSLPRLEALSWVSNSQKPISPSFQGVSWYRCAGAKLSSLGKRWSDSTHGSLWFYLLSSFCYLSSFFLHPSCFPQLKGFPVDTFFPSYSAFHLWVFHG